MTSTNSKGKLFDLPFVTPVLVSYKGGKTNSSTSRRALFLTPNSTCRLYSILYVGLFFSILQTLD